MPGPDERAVTIAIDMTPQQQLDQAMAYLSTAAKNRHRTTP